MSQTQPLARIGVFGIGLAAYWPQFEGLQARLEGYQRAVEARLAEYGGEVISAGLVDSAPAALAAGDHFAGAHRQLCRGTHRAVGRAPSRPQARKPE